MEDRHRRAPTFADLLIQLAEAHDRELAQVTGTVVAATPPPRGGSDTASGFMARIRATAPSISVTSPDRDVREANDPYESLPGALVSQVQSFEIGEDNRASTCAEIQGAAHTKRLFPSSPTDKRPLTLTLQAVVPEDSLSSSNLSSPTNKERQSILRGGSGSSAVLRAASLPAVRRKQGPRRAATALSGFVRKSTDSGGGNAVTEGPPTHQTHFADEQRAVFADAESMKQKVRQAIGNDPYSVTKFYHTHGVAQRLARSQMFEQATLFVIAVNAIWLAIDADNNDEDVLTKSKPIFQIAEHTFTTFFVAEWLVRFLAFRDKRDVMQDIAFVFDTLLVFLMVTETWVLTVVLAMTAGPSHGVSLNLEIVRLVRLLRLTRVARLARLLRAMPELMVLIKGMMIAARSVFFTLCLLLVILYIFGIAFTTLSKGTSLHDDFRTVPISIAALLLGGIVPEQEDMANRLGREHIVFGAFFLLFVLLSSLTVMNMLVGVLVDVVQVVSSVEKEQIEVNFVRNNLLRIMQENRVDQNDDNVISKEEFKSLLQKREAARALQNIDVDAVGLVDFTDFIFQDDKSLSFGEFMETILQLRGSNKATVKDIVDLRKRLVQELGDLERRLFDKGHRAAHHGFAKVLA